ncbi:MAG: 50S ribosomal protein L25/general stress protein Ctc [Verrucomicrobiae bacterium]|nr:50S ribosomal protein L25/general stress protein Ctc [Verrucomicrobiae bacterium]
MAKAIDLKAYARAAKGRGPVGRLRRSGRVPAVLYGKRTDAVSLEVAEKDLNAAVHGTSSENVLLDLDMELGDKSRKTTAFVQHVQHDPVTGRILHVDLHEIAANEKLKAHVPVRSLGEPIGVKTFGGILENILRELHVECLPKDLPDRIEVDVSGLNVGQSIHVKEIAVPDGVAVLNSGDVVVFAVAAPTVAEEEAAPAEGAAEGAAGAAPAAEGAAPAAEAGQAPEAKGKGKG